MNATDVIAGNVASIEAVPAGVWAQVPQGTIDREWAIMWARRGYDVLAYEHRGVWYLWFQDQRIALGRAASAPAVAAASAEPAAASAEGGEKS